MSVLIAGWFSFTDGLATTGDLHAAELVHRWLTGAGYPCEVAIVPPFGKGIDWRSADPAAYTHVVFVCGPFGQYPGELQFLSRFAECCLIGINLSMLIELERWNPFDLLFERDSSIRTRPDITFGLPAKKTPVVGVCLVEAYGYPEGAVDRANSAISGLLTSKEMAVVAVDTRLDCNAVGLRTPSEVEALVARMDVVVTTRLHGMVLALKNGVPVVAIDPQTNGGKILRQAKTVGWPFVLREDTMTDDALLLAFEYLLDSCGAVEGSGVCSPCLCSRAGRSRSTHFRISARDSKGTGSEFSQGRPFDGGESRPHRAASDESKPCARRLGSRIPEGGASQRALDLEFLSCLARCGLILLGPQW